MSTTLTVAAAEQLCVALANASSDSTSAAVAKLLGCRPGVFTNSPHDKIVDSPFDWKSLATVLSRVQPREMKQSILSALLLCPDGYEIPWQAALYSITHCFDPLPVQCFWIEACDAWSNSNHDEGATTTISTNQATTPLGFMLRSIMAILSTQQQHYSLLTTLITHCATCRRHKIVLETLLDRIFHHRELAIPPFSCLVQFHQYWRPKDFRVVIAQKQNTVEDKKKDDLYAILVLARRGRTAHLWRRLLWKHCGDVSDIKNALNRLTPTELWEWRRALVIDDTILWPQALFILLLRRKLVVLGRPIIQQGDNNEQSDNVGKDLWLQLVNLVETNNTISGPASYDSTILYHGQGEEVPKLALLVSQTLHYGNRDALPREDVALVWMHAALDALEYDDTPETALAFVLVTLYCKVPAVRIIVVRKLLEAFPRGTANYNRNVPHVISILIHSVVLSLQGDDSLPKKDMLDPLSALAVALEDSSLPFDDFCQLACSLSKIPSGNKTLLKLGNGEQRGMRITKESAGEEENSIQKRGLYACIVLLHGEAPWGVLQHKAWRLLAAAILMGKTNKVRFDYPLRQWLFRQLKNSIVQGWMTSQVSCTHVWAACASRLLDYVPNNDTSFAWGCLYTVWWEQDEFVPAEGIVELFDLFFTTHEKVGPSIPDRGYAILRCLTERCDFCPPTSVSSIVAVFDAVVVSLVLAFTGETGVSLGFEERNMSAVMRQSTREIYQRLASNRPENDSQVISHVFPNNPISMKKRLPVQMGLLDVALKLLLGGSHQQEPPIAQDPTDLARLVGHIIERRREAKCQVREAQEEGILLLSRSIIGGFCDVFALALEDVANDTQCSHRQVGPSLSTIRSVWKLYMAGCTEASALKFISVLEENNTTVGSQMCGIIISSPADVDRVIQRVRCAVIELLLEHITVLLDLAKESTFRGKMTSDLIDLCLDMVSNLSSDLCSGLQGLSGGLTHNLFSGMIDCVDATLDFLQTDPNCWVKNHRHHRVADVCVTSGRLLETVLCSSVLQRPRLFRNVLCLWQLRIQKVVKRGLLCSLLADDRSLVSYNKHVVKASEGLFNQLATVLSRIDANNAAETSWPALAGHRHLCRNSELLAATPQNVATNGRGQFLSLPNEKVWARGFEVILQLYDDIFRTSLLMLGNGIDCFSTKESRQTYILTRTSDFVHAIDAILYLVTPRPGIGLVVRLPTQCKLALCACLDNFFALQAQALDRLFTISRKSSLQFTEASCAFVAWLVSHKGGSTLENGVHHWYEAVKNSDSEENGPGGAEKVLQHNERSVLKWLCKVVSRVDVFMTSTADRLDSFAGGAGSCTDLSVEETSAQWEAIESAIRHVEEDANLSDLLETRVKDWKKLSLKNELQNHESKAKRSTKRKKPESGQLDTKSKRSHSSNHVVHRWHKIDKIDHEDESKVDARDSYADLDDFLVGG